MKNDICNENDLGNESSVEHFFVSRLLAALGYSDSQISSKESIESIKVSQGRRKVQYKPDYIVTVRRRPRIVIDAKATSEDITDWVGQCGSYCLEINKRFKSNPASIFVLTNGFKTEVYAWDQEKPLLTLSFEDFRDDNPKYKKLVKLIGEKSVVARVKERVENDSSGELKASEGEHLFRRHGIDDINAAFAWCHQYIYKKTISARPLHSMDLSN